MIPAAALVRLVAILVLKGHAVTRKHDGILIK